MLCLYSGFPFSCKLFFICIPLFAILKFILPRFAISALEINGALEICLEIGNLWKIYFKGKSSSPHFWHWSLQNFACSLYVSIRVNISVMCILREKCLWSNPFYITDLFWYLLKISENQRFSNIFRGYQKRSVARNGLSKYTSECL